MQRRPGPAVPQAANVPATKATRPRDTRAEDRRRTGGVDTEVEVDARIFMMAPPRILRDGGSLKWAQIARIPPTSAGREMMEASS